MSDEDVVSRAYAQLAVSGGDPLALAEPWKSIVLVDTAVGLIENGGVRYFFEADFPRCPDYSNFSSAFEAVGLEAAAGCLNRLVAEFPSRAPHLDRTSRVRFLAAPSDAFVSLSAQLESLLSATSDLDRRMAMHGDRVAHTAMAAGAGTHR